MCERILIRLKRMIKWSQFCRYRSYPSIRQSGGSLPTMLSVFKRKVFTSDVFLLGNIKMCFLNRTGMNECLIYSRLQKKEWRQTFVPVIAFLQSMRKLDFKIKLGRSNDSGTNRELYLLTFCKKRCALPSLIMLLRKMTLLSTVAD